MKANVIFIGKKQNQKMSDSLACQVSLTSLTILLGMIHTSSFKASLQKKLEHYAFWPYINQDKSKSKCLAALYTSKGTQSIEKAKYFFILYAWFLASAFF